MWVIRWVKILRNAFDLTAAALARTPLRRLLATSFLVSLGLILLISYGLNYYALRRVLWMNGMVRLEDRIHVAFRDLEPQSRLEDAPEKVHRIWELPVRVPSNLANTAGELTRIMGNTNQFQAAILDPDGKIISRFPLRGDTWPTILNWDEWTALRERAALALQNPRIHYVMRLRYGEDNDHRQVLVAPLMDGTTFVGYVWLRSNWRMGQSALRNYAELSSLTLLLLVAVTISLSVWLAGIWTRPLERLAVSADHVARGDLSARANLGRGGNEVYAVARAFDLMLDRIQILFDSQRLFLADASHELKTPITALSGLVQMLELMEEKSPDARRERSLGLMGRELDRMERLVADLLTLSRAEQQKLQVSAISVRELCEDALSAALLGAPGRKIETNLEAADDEQLVGDADALVRAMRNLLDNALHYTPPERPIELVALIQGGELILSVRDQGCGISKVHLPHLGERFYRADPSRARKSGGTGLGLAIVRAIMEQHNGRLEIQSVEGQGTQANLILPRSS